MLPTATKRGRKSAWCVGVSQASIAETGHMPSGIDELRAGETVWEPAAMTDLLSHNLPPTLSASADVTRTLTFSLLVLYRICISLVKMTISY